jgi:hypothetical protein
VILLQINPAFNDEPKIVCKGFYKIDDTLIFTWSSIFIVGHYRWLHSLICQLFPNHNANYVVHITHHLLDFLQLWISIVGCIAKDIIMLLFPFKFYQ